MTASQGEPSGGVTGTLYAGEIQAWAGLGGAGRVGEELLGLVHGAGWIEEVRVETVVVVGQQLELCLVGPRRPLPVLGGVSWLGFQTVFGDTPNGPIAPPPPSCWFKVGLPVLAPWAFGGNVAWDLGGMTWAPMVP